MGRSIRSPAYERCESHDSARRYPSDFCRDAAPICKSTDQAELKAAGDRLAVALADADEEEMVAEFRPMRGADVPRAAIEDNRRMSLRTRAEEKTLVLGAVAIQPTDLTDFVIKRALRAAKDLIAEAEPVQLSTRDSLRVLDRLENPPGRNAKLLAAAWGIAAAAMNVMGWHEDADESTA
jgi:uncharacterized protein (DUF1778 family)